MLELYHGSNVAIDKIDLSKGHINKDFGKGFYLTSLPQQAMEMAKRKARQFLDAKPVVTTFLFDENELTSGTLNVKVFHTVSENGLCLFFKTERLRGLDSTMIMT